MYSQVTQGIRIEVNPQFVPEESRPELNYFFFAYRIRITNEGEAPAQLLNRHWIITDGHGTVHEVKGPGVIGKQPKLEPGESFEYTSFCPLPTPTGNMRGTFQMIGPEDRLFDVRVPLFFLRDLRNIH